MNITDVRKRFFEEFSEFTQQTYLLAYAAVALPSCDLKEIADGLGVALEELVDPADEKWNRAIKGDEKKLRPAACSLHRFVIDLLVIDLDARLHALLDEINGRSHQQNNNPTRFEDDLSYVKDRDPALFAGVVMLAEARNSLIHNAGVLNEHRHQRLRDAGVTEPKIVALAKSMEDGLKFADFLRFKSVVRNVANMALESIENGNCVS